MDALPRSDAPEERGGAGGGSLAARRAGRPAGARGGGSPSRGRGRRACTGLKGVYEGVSGRRRVNHGDGSSRRPGIAGRLRASSVNGPGTPPGSAPRRMTNTPSAPPHSRWCRPPPPAALRASQRLDVACRRWLPRPVPAAGRRGDARGGNTARTGGARSGRTRRPPPRPRPRWNCPRRPPRDD